MADELFNIALEDNDYTEVEAKKEMGSILDKLQEISQSLKEISQYQVPVLPDSIKVSNLKETPRPLVYSPLDEQIADELNQIKHFLRKIKPPEEKPEEPEEELTFIVDKFSTKVTYIGHAKVGAKENEPVWRIKKITDEKDQVTCEYADGDTDFDNSWSKRDTLKYA